MDLQKKLPRKLKVKNSSKIEDNNDKPRLVVIVGPTASGKSELAVFLALRFGLRQAQKQYGIQGAEIISADSRQVYEYMDIGTGKITKKEMAGIPHHLLDVAHPSRQFTVVQYKKKALKVIRDIQRRGKLPILVGGTGFYIQAVVDNVDFPAVPPNNKLRSKLRSLSAEELFKKLQKLDPNRAATIDAKNKRRLVRALEIIEATGKLFPSKAGILPAFDTLILGIDITREELNKKIEKRLKKQFSRGLVAEIKRLHEKYGVSWRRLEYYGLEARWVAQYLQGKTIKQELWDNLLQDTKKYAKRQMTWFHRDHRIRWVKNKKEAERIVASFLKNYPS